MTIKMEYGREGARYMMNWGADARHLIEGIYAKENSAPVKFPS